MNVRALSTSTPAAVPEVPARPVSRSPGETPSVPGDGFDGSNPVALRAAPAGSPLAPVQARALWPLSPGRSSADALQYIQALDARLALSPASQADRTATMGEDAHTFFRANPGLFHADLQGVFAGSTQLLVRPAPTVLILGDVHLKNFGTLRGPDGAAVFAPNDFDQAAPGSPEADLERLAVSLTLTARAAGLNEEEVAGLVEQLGQSYSEEVARIAASGQPARPYLTADQAKGKIADRIEKADGETRQDLLGELLEKGDTRFLRNEELLEPSPADAERIRAAVASHELTLGDQAAGVERPLRVLDVVEKLGSGGSSRGLPRHYALVAGAGTGAAPVVLELKELAPMALQDTGASRGDALLAAQRLRELGGAHNPLGGAVAQGDRTLFIRELEPEKGDLKGKDLDSEKELLQAAEQTGLLLARQHALTPDQALALADWIGGEGKQLGKALQGFASEYAAQVEADYAAFTR
ncbi:MAG: DUF2252 domain-containing protein [Myxococcota bacterium]|nr:DUF2252 domain-containing protein [Myxococcota bacterium]